MSETTRGAGGKPGWMTDSTQDFVHRLLAGKEVDWYAEMGCSIKPGVLREEMVISTPYIQGAIPGTMEVLLNTIGKKPVSDIFETLFLENAERRKKQLTEQGRPMEFQRRYFVGYLWTWDERYREVSENRSGADTAPEGGFHMSKDGKMAAWHEEMDMELAVLEKEGQVCAPYVGGAIAGSMEALSEIQNMGDTPRAFNAVFLKSAKRKNKRLTKLKISLDYRCRFFVGYRWAWEDVRKISALLPFKDN